MITKMMNNQKNNTFEGVAGSMVSLHEKKNHDYGNAFGDTYQELAKKSPLMANGYALGSLKNKMGRLTTLMSGEPAKVENESIEDSLIDLASYSLMILVEMRNLTNNNSNGSK